MDIWRYVHVHICISIVCVYINIFTHKRYIYIIHNKLYPCPKFLQWTTNVEFKKLRNMDTKKRRAALRTAENQCINGVGGEYQELVSTKHINQELQAFWPPLHLKSHTLHLARWLMISSFFWAFPTFFWGCPWHFYYHPSNPQHKMPISNIFLARFNWFV